MLKFRNSAIVYMTDELAKRSATDNGSYSCDVTIEIKGDFIMTDSYAKRRSQHSMNRLAAALDKVCDEFNHDHWDFEKTTILVTAEERDFA